MCGICGLINTSPGDRASEELLSSMCQAIEHRGPDDQGVYVDRNAGLGARRLSILDLEGGHQPLSNEDGTIWAAHNGEIYNYPELRAELEGRGHRFKSGTDTEVVVHCYEEWGEDFVQKLRGMFASAVWDGGKEKLIVTRDRLGIKPLYYTHVEGLALIFGSELKSILVHPSVERSVNPEALDLFLTLEYIPAPLTIFRNIHKLPAGCFLVFEKGQLRIQRYWDLEEIIGRSDDSPLRPLNDIMDELYELLKDSVRMRLLSDVPLGAFLSGGVDSSCIVGLMSELGTAPLKTFSIGFEDQTYNELGFARKIANKFETEHEELIIQPQALDLTEKLIRHLDEPFGDFSIFPTFLVSKMAKEHVTVILSGDGGDEVFGGYEHYQAQKLAGLPGSRLASRLLSPILMGLPPSPKKKGTWNKLRRYVQGFSNSPDLRHIRWMTWMTDREKHGLYTEGFRQELSGISPINHRPPFSEWLDSARNFDRTNGELYLDLQSYMIDDILVKVDRMSMATSLETRVPLIDHKIVEFAFKLPGHMKLKGQTTKWIFKKTMERLLPKENIYRKKEGFSIPIKHWLKTDLKDLLLDTLSEKRINDSGYFNFDSVNHKIERHLSDRENYSHQLWALLVFEIWKDNYL
ncbi:asparagine synthase (glutamine-hydrolyzing) [Acidobacteriota bacterium]